MKKHHNDFTYTQWSSRKNPNRILWQVLLAKQEVVTTCTTEIKAIDMCKELNNDRWYLLRGQTRADRVPSFG